MFLHVIKSLLFGNVPLEGRESDSSHGLHRCVVCWFFVCLFCFVCFFFKLTLVRGEGNCQTVLAADLELDHRPQRHRGLILFEVSSLLEVGSGEGPAFICAL